MTGCQHLSVAPFSVKHFTRVHVCDKFPVLKKWREQYVWLEILSPKFHRYDVEIFQLYFHLCFIWSRGHRFLEQRFTIAKHSEWGVYSLQDSSQKPNMPVPKMLHLVLTYIHLQLVCSVLLCLILVCIVWPYMVPYSEKLLRDKTFVNFEVLWLFTKVFSAKFGGVASFGGSSEQSAKVFSTNFFLFSLIHTSFFPAEVYHHTVTCQFSRWRHIECLSSHVYGNYLISASSLLPH